MVRPYHSLSLLSLLFGRFRYCIMYLVCCIRLRLSWDLSAPYVPLFLGCESRWDSCVNHIPDRDGRGWGRCQTVWFSIFSCRHGRTSRIDFFFFFFITSCERCGKCVSCLWCLGSGSRSGSGSCHCAVSSWIMHYVHVCITLRLPGRDPGSRCRKYTWALVNITSNSTQLISFPLD